MLIKKSKIHQWFTLKPSFIFVEHTAEVSKSYFDVLFMIIKKWFIARYFFLLKKPTDLCVLPKKFGQLIWFLYYYMQCDPNYTFFSLIYLHSLLNTSFIKSLIKIVCTFFLLFKKHLVWLPFCVMFFGWKIKIYVSYAENSETLKW